jgi:glycosyltransferase involved in cell wall biosynthesis
MKVVHLNTSDFGGAAMAAIQLHLALLDSGVDSDLLTLNKTRNDIPRHTLVEPFKLGGSDPINKLRYKSRRLMEHTGLVEDRSSGPGNRDLQGRPPGFEIFTLPYSFFNIVEHPLVKAADVIHLHWVSYGMIDFEAFFGACSKPVVWTLHDMNPFTGGCHHADDCSGYRRACETCPQLRDKEQAHVYWAYKQKALAKFPADRLQLVAPSRWLAGRAEASTIMQGRSCRVIPNGFDVAHFSYDRHARERLDLPSDKRIILFNALDVNNPRKGMQFLLPALKRMHEHNVLLVSVGGRTVAWPEGIPVHDAGYITSTEQMALYYSAADLFVLPSMAENLPNTISESLLCGTPVVAFNVGGIPEQVHAGNGMLVEQYTSAALEAAIHAALGMTWDHLTIAQQASQRYDRRTVAKEYQRIYGSEP